MNQSLFVAIAWLGLLSGIVGFAFMIAWLLKEIRSGYYNV